jgi:hypothetical protein
MTAQNRDPMLGDRPGEPQKMAQNDALTAAFVNDERRPCERPRVWQRGTVERSTLISGTDCVFEPPPC